MTLEKLSPVQHFTEPPPRYTEATLIKKMEELGIGRPSTYTSTLTVLRDREYVRLEAKRLIPEDKGRLVIAFLESFFDRYVEYDFTANLEEQLDRISNGEIDWKQLLQGLLEGVFRRGRGHRGPARVAGAGCAERPSRPAHLPAQEGQDDSRKCPACESGRLSLKIGRYGALSGAKTIPTAAIPAS